jgi:hypothetical protein
MSAPRGGTCSTCKFWTAKDPSLDQGRDILGTCTKPPDYFIISHIAERSAHYNEAGYLEHMRKSVKEEGMLLQVHPRENGIRAYLRTPPSHGCFAWASKVPVQAPSLTATSAAS